MSPPPRSLTFAVSTSLLTASLSLAACDDQRAANPGPVDKGADKQAEKGDGEDNVNVGPETPPQPEVPPEPPPPQEIHVNEGPEPIPEPLPDKVNPGPEVEKPEPKRVNTRPSP